jgi:hypothetical protein
LGGCRSGYKLAINKTGLCDAASLGYVASDDDDGKANEGILEFRKVESLEPLSLVINPAVDANIALIYE